jgi:hypothetical protein
LRFETDNGRALNGRDVYLKDERDKVTGQPSTVVVCSTVVFSHGHLLEEVSELRDAPPIIVVPQVGEEEVAIAALSVLESCPESSALADAAT